MSKENIEIMINIWRTRNDALKSYWGRVTVVDNSSKKQKTFTWGELINLINISGGLKIKAVKAPDRKYDSWRLYNCNKPVRGLATDILTKS